jgi:hypothetical protein
MGLMMSDTADKEISTDLTLSDLKIINNLIEVAATKGIIRPADYTILGNIYEKIASIINEKKS